MKAHLMQTPPASILPYRGYFDRQTKDMRSAYYMVGNFIAAEEMKIHLSLGTSVVVDRFYASTIAYSMKNERVLPAPGSIDYGWPPELLQPHKVFYLTVNEEERLRRRASRLSVKETAEEAELREDSIKGARINKVYRYMGCVEISSEGSVESIISRLNE
jgi:thymidylate kinase